MFSEPDAHFSPDGHRITYTSDESGQDEVYVQSYPDPGQKVQISTGGGTLPRWSAHGRELYFLSVDRRLMAVPVTLTPQLQVGTPVALFETSVGLGTNRYAPSADGDRFLLSVPTPENGAAPIVVILNWADHVDERAPRQSP
jgi:hypothetical protein